jgi:hypothetical protein
MTIAGAIAGFLAAFAAFWFIGGLTGDNWYAMAASLAVFCFGTLAAGEGAVLEIFFEGFSYPYFPGFRRYIPALAMPAFFGFVGLIWKILSERGHPCRMSTTCEILSCFALKRAEAGVPQGEPPFCTPRRLMFRVLRLFVFLYMDDRGGVPCLRGSGVACPEA